MMWCSFIERLKSLHWESITTTEEMQNEEEIRSQIKEEYDRRLKEEIKNIGHLYNSYEGEMRLTIQAIFDNKACSQLSFLVDFNENIFKDYEMFLMVMVAVEGAEPAA